MMNFSLQKRVSIVTLILSLLVWAKPVGAQSNIPQLLFVPSSVTAEVGSPITVDLHIDTAGESVGGVGAKIKFDPSLVEIQSVETIPLFPDYPTATYDNQAGLVTISGVVQSIDQLVSNSGPFAKLTFILKQPTPTSIDYIFEPNQTTDSNIAILSGTGDALQQVTSLTIIPSMTNISPRSEETSETIGTAPSPGNNEEVTKSVQPSDSSNTWDISLIGLGIILFAITIGLHLHLTIQIRQLHDEIRQIKKKQTSTK